MDGQTGRSQLDSFYTFGYEELRTIGWEDEWKDWR